MTSYAISSPILFSGNPSAVPVQNFDFVFIPKDVVQTHLPAFEKKKLRLQAIRAAEMLKVPIPQMDDTIGMVQLVDLYKRHQISKNDPNGSRRKQLKKELCQMNTELDVLIPLRKNVISDMQRLQQPFQTTCNRSTRLSDQEYLHCKAIDKHLKINSGRLMQMNKREKVILQRIRDIRKEILLF